MSWLDDFKSTDPYSDITSYDIGKIRNLYKTVELNGGYLVIHEDGEINVNFALFEHYADEHVTLVFRGSGTGGSLRECRHTYWGKIEDGYVFYPNPNLIAAAFKELEVYFDY